MKKLTDLIHGGPQVLKHSNPVISGYGALSPCCSTGPLYQQVLTPQVPPETEMGTWLGELLTGLTECSTKGRGGMAFSLMCPLFLFSAVKSQHILCSVTYQPNILILGIPRLKFPLEFFYSCCLWKSCKSLSMNCSTVRPSVATKYWTIN